MRKLYASGVRLRNMYGDLFEHDQPATLDTIKLAILECEYPIHENFRKVVQHAPEIQF